MPTPLIIGTNGFVSAIDPATGHELWRTKLSTGSFFSSTSQQDVAVVVKGAVVFAGCAGHLFGLDAADGAILWHNELPGLGHNDVAMAIDGVAIQYLVKEVDRNTHGSGN
jgi:outer membrane protein assembly factor BamB